MDLENSTVINNNLTLESGKTVTVPRWCELILCTFLLISAILAIGGNSLFLIVEIKNKFKTSIDWLVFFISANDFLFAVFNIPIYVIYQSSLILTELFQHNLDLINVSYLTACYLYQVMMTLHFLNDVANDAESKKKKKKKKKKKSLV